MDRSSRQGRLHAVVVIVDAGVRPNEAGARNRIRGAGRDPHVIDARRENLEAIRTVAISGGRCGHAVIRATNGTIRARQHEFHTDARDARLRRHQTTQTVIIGVVPDQIAHGEAAPQTEVHGAVRVRIAIAIRDGFLPQREVDHRTAQLRSTAAGLERIIVTVHRVVRIHRRPPRLRIARWRRGHQVVVARA